MNEDSPYEIPLRDDQKPEPEIEKSRLLPTPTTRSEVLDDGKIDPGDYTPKLPDGDVSPKWVAVLAAWQPFLRLFIVYAEAQYGQSRYPYVRSDRDRIDTAVRRHPKFFRFCRKADSIFLGSMLAVMFLVIGGTGGYLLKALIIGLAHS